jgi:hypothetical protein
MLGNFFRTWRNRASTPLDSPPQHPLAESLSFHPASNSTLLNCTQFRLSCVPCGGWMTLSIIGSSPFLETSHPTPQGMLWNTNQLTTAFFWQSTSCTIGPRSSRLKSRLASQKTEQDGKTVWPSNFWISTNEKADQQLPGAIGYYCTAFRPNMRWSGGGWLRLLPTDSLPLDPSAGKSGQALLFDSFHAKQT